jgi:hypothetical protein
MWLGEKPSVVLIMLRSTPSLARRTSGSRSLRLTKYGWCPAARSAATSSVVRTRSGTRANQSSSRALMSRLGSLRVLPVSPFRINSAEGKRVACSIAVGRREKAPRARECLQIRLS